MEALVISQIMGIFAKLTSGRTMKILFVVNNYYASGNGLSASARRTVKFLREAGEDVRVLSGKNHEAEKPQPDYILKDFHVPVFDPLVQSHGYKFAKTDISVIMEATKYFN